MTRKSKRPWSDCDREAALMAMLCGGAPPDAGKELRAFHSFFVPNRYQVREWLLFSSCTAMPMLEWGYEACATPYHYVLEATDKDDVSNRLGVIEAGFASKLLAALSAPRETKVLVTASPADAFRLAATLCALQGNGSPSRVLIPSVLEVGSEVPNALQGRDVLPGPDYGQSLLPGSIEVTQIPLRGGNGELLDEMKVTETFSRFKEHSHHRTFGYTTLGDATGAVGPIPYAADVMDATQMRVRGSKIAEYLTRGFAMVISGSTFLGGPAHSGALLLPKGTFGEEVWLQAWSLWRQERVLAWQDRQGFSSGFGNILRWMPGLMALERLAALGAKADIRIAQMTAQMAAFLREFPAFEVFDSRSQHQVAVCGRDSGIVPFAVRMGDRRWMTMPDLTALWQKLAEEGVLLGHPVQLGARAALCLSIAASDVTNATIDHKLARLADVLAGAGFTRRRAGGNRNRTVQAARRGMPETRCLQ